MGIKVEFDNNQLHELIKIEKINTSITPSRDNYSKVIPTSNGSFYTGYRYQEKKFSISCGIVAKDINEYNEKILKLSKILNVEKPKKLKINDSNIIYYAIPNGDNMLEKFRVGIAKFDLEFICFDALGYDEHYTGLTSVNKTFNFTDMGTMSSLPIFGFTFKKDSTFIYLTNEKKQTLLIGTPKDEQLPTKPLNMTVVSNDCTDSSTFTDGGNVVVSDNRLTDGTYGVGNLGRSIVATSYGTETPKKWNGATFRLNLDRGVEQFETRVNISFSSRGKNFTIINPKDLVRVVNKSGTYMRETSSPHSTIIQLIPYQTDLNIIKMGSGNDNGYCTVSYKNKTGWIATKDIYRINIANNKLLNEEEFAEEQMGLVEVLGMDVDGQVLFRFHMRDNNKYFEHNIPEIYIQDKVYLTSNTITPTPNTMNVKDENSAYVGLEEIPSGVFGDWNDFTGTFALRRRKLENGQYRWWGRISRTEDGVNISQEMHMGEGVISNNLSKKPLNHLVFYIAKYEDCTPVEMMSINHIKVIDISNENGEKTEEVNYTIFQNGDYLEIDNEKCEIRLNGESYMQHLDIGSQFFDVNENSKVFYRTDDEDVETKCSYRKRYL